MYTPAARIARRDYHEGVGPSSGSLEVPPPTYTANAIPQLYKFKLMDYSIPEICEFPGHANEFFKTGGVQVGKGGRTPSPQAIVTNIRSVIFLLIFIIVALPPQRVL